MKRNVLIGAVIAIALVVGVGGVLYAFGTPAQPDYPASTPTPASVNETPASVPSALPGDEAASPGVPAPDPSVPLAIEIPGCVCHSDDPQIVAEHAEYRMNQCAGCHAGQVPTGQ